jgi:hypothetical protein
MIDAASLPRLISSRYRPIRLIASGGMGSVYEVEHVMTGQRLALKVLWSSANPSAPPEAQARFKREVRACGRINSENVVRVTDADVAPELGGAPFLVMELLDGTDLERAAAPGPVDPATVVGWLGQVAEALDKAHRLGIVHRDLKPENLFLATQADGRVVVKILDFGIVKMLDDTGATGSEQIIGTPRYMAPEQASAQAMVKPETDRCALGLVAYRLLVGESYHQGGVMVILGQLLHGELRPPSERGCRLGPAFDAWFLKACHRDPGQRFASAGEQIEALAAALGVPAAPVAASGKVVSAARRWRIGDARLRWTLLACGSLALAAGAFVIARGGVIRTSDEDAVCGLNIKALPPACAACLARACCQPAEACGETAACGAVEGCLRGCPSGDAPCRTRCRAGAPSAARLPQEAIDTCRATSCAEACLPPRWACLGRVIWSSPRRSPARINIRTIATCIHCGVAGNPIADGPGGSPVAGASVRVCSLADPGCGRPIASGRTDDGGAVTLGIDTFLYAPPLAVYLEYHQAGYEDTLVNIGQPLTGDLDVGRVTLLNRKADVEPTAANFGATCDPTRASVDAYVADCNGRPAAKDIVLTWLDRDAATVTRGYFAYSGAAIAMNLPVNASGITRVVARDSNNRLVATVHAVVRPGANTELRLAPAP